MSPSLQFLAVVAATGCGLMSGLLFAFSLVVMRALRELPPEQGMSTMQRINVLIIHPLFLLLFLGTALACAALLLWPGKAPWALSLGASAYLLGPVGVTLAFNVPLNNRLAALHCDQATVEWPPYVSAWLRWNHVRTAIGVAGTALLCHALRGAAGA
jgi:uncharacterized membrane protein